MRVASRRIICHISGGTRETSMGVILSSLVVGVRLQFDVRKTTAWVNKYLPVIVTFAVRNPLGETLAGRNKG